MSTAPETISVDFLKAPILLKVAGGPMGPPGPPNAGVYLKGVASAWPPATAPAVGDLWVVPTTPPAGAPAWALAGHGAFWDGNTWVDAGILGGPKGDRGEPGPPLNIRGTAVSWVPDSHPKPGDLWILPDPLPVGTPAGFTAGGAAGWDDITKTWIPLAAIRGPAGRSIQVFGPSPAPPVGVPVFKGDVWLASDPSLFSPTFDPSTIRPIPGPPGPNGPTGPSAFEVWKTTVGRPTASLADYLDAIKGAPGATGAKGPAGETLKVAGVVPDEAHLPATPPNLTVYMTKDGVLWIYNPSSAAAAASGWVNLGKIAGPAGQPATMMPAVATDAGRPAVGLPGQMVYVTATGHVWGWDDVAKAWVDGGKFGIGAGSVDDGTTQGQMLVWDATARRWAALDVLRLPSGTDDGDLISWDASLGQWVSTTNEMGSEENVDLPQTPAEGEGSVPVYDYDTNRFDVRRLRMEDIDDGPGAYVPAAGDLLGWDAVLGRYVPTPAPAGTLAGLSDVTATGAAGGVLTADGTGHFNIKPATTTLAALKDVDVATTAPVAGDTLTADGAGKWKNTPPTSYTKVEIDNKLTTLVTGLEHGVSVIDRTNNPPTTPVDDEFYIVGIAPLGAWVGKNNQLAYWNGTAWQFALPQANEAHLVESESATYTYNATTANWVKVANASTATASGDLWQVGSVQQSLLTESQWATALGVEAAKWVLADGRDVSGSRWATLTGQSRIPDLRGAFIRGAGQNGNAFANWNGGAVGSTHGDTTRLPRNTPFTADTAGDHHHVQTTAAFKGGSSGVHTWDGNSPGGNGEYTFNAGNHTHTISGGDVETAPVHVSMNTFIKIN